MRPFLISSFFDILSTQKIAIFQALLNSQPCSETEKSLPIFVCFSALSPDTCLKPEFGFLTNRVSN